MRNMLRLFRRGNQEYYKVNARPEDTAQDQAERLARRLYGKTAGVQRVMAGVDTFEITKPGPEPGTTLFGYFGRIQVG